jgi:P2-related tail formation protein
VHESPLGAAAVLDEAVAVEIAVLVDPGECPKRGLPKLANEGRVVRPAPDLGQEDEVERLSRA